MSRIFWIFLCFPLFLSPDLICQEEPYTPQFEALKKYPNAQVPLLKRLDSIFLNSEILELSNELDLNPFIEKVVNIGYAVDKYDSVVNKILHITIPTRAIGFVDDFAYSLSPPSQPGIRELGPNGLVTDFSVPSNTSNKNETTSDVEFLSISSEGRLKANRNLEYKIHLNKFYLAKYGTYYMPPVFMYNSIIEGRLSANFISGCIIEDGFFQSDKSLTSPWLDEDLVFPNYPYADYVHIEDSYLKKYAVKGSLNDFVIENSKIDSLAIYADTIKNINFDAYQFEKFNSLGMMIPSEYENVYTGESRGLRYISNRPKWGYVHISDTYTDQLTIHNDIRHLRISNVEAKSMFLNSLTDTIYLAHVKSERISISPEKIDNNSKTKVFFSHIDYDNLDMQWTGYELYKPSFWSEEELNSTYKNLLASFKKKGFEDSYQELDIQYKEWGYNRKGKFVSNWIQKNWWNYGYNKSLIFRNTGIIFLIFVFFNVFFLGQLSKKLYEDYEVWKFVSKKKKSISNPLLYRLSILPASIFYTARIFFGIGFKYEKLRYGKRLGFNQKTFGLLYFFLIFISGLICLGYIANYVITT